MLWNTIYEFFVKYIFGGYYRTLSGELGSYHAFLTAYYDSNSQLQYDYTRTVLIDMFGTKLTLGNYLSLISTIISMVVILVLCCALIKKIYNMCAHIIG